MFALFDPFTSYLVFPFTRHFPAVVVFFRTCVGVRKRKWLLPGRSWFEMVLVYHDSLVPLSLLGRPSVPAVVLADVFRYAFSVVLQLAVLFVATVFDLTRAYA